MLTLCNTRWLPWPLKDERVCIRSGSLSWSDVIRNVAGVVSAAHTAAVRANDTRRHSINATPAHGYLPDQTALPMFLDNYSFFHPAEDSLPYGKMIYSLRVTGVPGQNGDKLKRRKSKRRYQNGDNPKRRQYKGNMTKTATEKCGQNGDKEQRTAICFKEGC